MLLNPDIAAVVAWLRTLHEPQDPSQLADEIEAIGHRRPEGMFETTGDPEKQVPDCAPGIDFEETRFVELLTEVADLVRYWKAYGDDDPGVLSRVADVARAFKHQPAERCRPNAPTRWACAHDPRCPSEHEHKMQSAYDAQRRPDAQLHYKCLTCSLVVEAHHRYGMCPGKTGDAAEHTWSVFVPDPRRSEATPRARLDADGTAKPLTEIVAVMPESAIGEAMTVHVARQRTTLRARRSTRRRSKESRRSSNVLVEEIRPPKAPYTVDYRCGKCQAAGLKLWRGVHGCKFKDGHELLCAACLAPDEVVSDDGRAPCALLHGQMTDQVSSGLPAIPVDDTFWGYSSVPTADVRWWKALPTYAPGRTSATGGGST